MDKSNTQSGNLKYSQLMLAVNELDEKLDSVGKGLSEKVDAANTYMCAKLEWLVDIVQRLIKEVESSTSGKPAGKISLEEEWLTTAEAATILKRSVYRVRRDINEGRYPAKERNGKYLIRKSDILSYLENL